MQKLPTELAALLRKNKETQASWSSLTPIAQRDFITWINSAKQETTRIKRAERVPDMLRSGKRRPCCYAVVPMDLYRELGANPKAKATWKTLSATERRDFSDWVSTASSKEDTEQRVEKVKKLLMQGKKSLGSKK